MRVCVLGAGIAGLAAAWQLQREGHEVTIIERAGAGAGASGANGAQLSYAYVQPLADPAIWAQLPSLLFSRNSPLTLRPRWDFDQWRWGASFLAACRTRISRQSTVQLLALAADSRRAFERLLAEQAIECDFSATGKLVLYSDEGSFAHARRQLALQQSLGVEQRAASAAECVEIEPALAGYRRNIAGAIYTPGECAADCYKVCLELLRLLRIRGARTIFETEVSGLVTRRGRVAAVQRLGHRIGAEGLPSIFGVQHVGQVAGEYAHLRAVISAVVTLHTGDLQQCHSEQADGEPMSEAMSDAITRWIGQARKQPLTGEGRTEEPHRLPVAPLQQPDVPCRFRRSEIEVTALQVARGCRARGDAWRLAGVQTPTIAARAAGPLGRPRGGRPIRKREVLPGAGGRGGRPRARWASRRRGLRAGRSA